jgi:CrcB protein
MTVNVVGSGLIGVALCVIEPGSRWQISTATREFINHFFMIGVLGGFTTFSSFSLQTLNLVREQHWAQASANVVLSVVSCLLAVSLGYSLTAAFSHSHP